MEGIGAKRRIPKPNFIILVILELTSSDLTVYEPYLNVRGAEQLLRCFVGNNNDSVCFYVSFTTWDIWHLNF